MRFLLRQCVVKVLCNISSLSLGLAHLYPYFAPLVSLRDCSRRLDKWKSHVPEL